MIRLPVRRVSPSWCDAHDALSSAEQLFEEAADDHRARVRGRDLSLDRWPAGSPPRGASSSARSPRPARRASGATSSGSAWPGPRELLREGSLPVNRVASAVGLPPAGAVREGFRRHHGSPAVGFRDRLANARPDAGPSRAPPTIDWRAVDRACRRRGQRPPDRPDAQARAGADDRDRRGRLDRRNRDLAADRLVPRAGSTAAEDIDTLYDVLLIASVPVFVLVMTIAIYSVVRFRAKPGDLSDGAPIHGNTRLEVIWVTIPFLMVTALAIYGWIVLDDIEAKKPRTSWWSRSRPAVRLALRVPGGEGQSNQLVLPVDRPVDFRITSERRDPLVLGARVPAQVGRRAGPHDHDPADARPRWTSTRWSAPSCAASATRRCASRCGSSSPSRVRRLGAPSASGPAARAAASGGRRRHGRRRRPTARQIFTEPAAAPATRSPTPGHGTSARSSTSSQRRAERKPGTPARPTSRSRSSNPSAFVVKGFPDGVMPADYADQLSPEEIDALVKYLLGGQQMTLTAETHRPRLVPRRARRQVIGFGFGVRHRRRRPRAPTAGTRSSNWDAIITVSP